MQESFGPLLANASTLIRTGCEWDPACLLDTLLGCLNLEIVLSALHSHGIFQCGHRLAEEGNCGGCYGPSLVLTINRDLLVQSQTSWFPAGLQLEISDFLFCVCNVQGILPEVSLKWSECQKQDSLSFLTPFNNNNKVFIKRKILSIETILIARTHTHHTLSLIHI